MKLESFEKPQIVAVDADNAGQRIDNFLLRILKGVPKSAIYRIVRKGEVRVNKKRIKPEYKILDGDLVRIPPVKVKEVTAQVNTKLTKVSELEDRILYEDDVLIIVNKPHGMAVHGGSGLSFGLIEALRALRPQQKFLELVHRLDRDTSGCLAVAKKRSALKHLHEQLRDKTMNKVYHALVRGHWPKHRTKVSAPLQKFTLKSGERMVNVDAQGKPSLTHTNVIQYFSQCTLIEAKPITGRTHQIRVHCKHAGHNIALDDKYGEGEFDKAMKDNGLNRLFLHAHSLSFIHPRTEKEVRFESPKDAQLTNILKKLDKTHD
jgi:23S rRNA pseudouridine955/2504/2580 synthase